MQKIDDLLKHIVPQKDESTDVIQCVFSISKIQLNKKDILFTEHKGFKKVRFYTSGAQKTKLTLVEGELVKKLHELGFMYETR